MDRAELDSRIKSLNIAVQAQDAPASIIAILETLKKDVVPTEELLRATRAGVVVARQRGNANKEIARLATEIVLKWKKMVEAAKSKKAKITAGTPPKSGSGGGGTSSPAQTSAPASNKAYSGNTLTRKWNTDDVDTKRTGTPTRDACIGLLYNGLAYMSEESTTAVLHKAMEVERAAFDAFGGETPEYKAKLRSLFQNLKHRQNRELGPRVMGGEIPAPAFVRMSHEQLKSAERRKEDAKLEHENMKNAQVAVVEGSISDQLKCGRCGQKRVSYTQAQTRSADEPMTTFCECTVCGNRWKFS